MFDAGLLILIVIAIGVGWSLGRGERKRREFTYVDWSQDYLQGVQSLFKEKPNEAIELLLSSLEKSTNSLEVRLALAGFYRKKGEIESAIQIHQALLAEPNLDPKQLAAVELALARDYLSAGLLDRAERLLQGLVREGSFCRTAALEHLVRIYEQEKEWKNAIECGEWLARAGGVISVQLAQYHCEEAERLLVLGEIDAARRHLYEALKTDKKSVRACFILAKIESNFERDDQVLRWLKKVRLQDPAFVPETLALAKKSFLRLDKKAEYQEYLQFCYQETRAVSLLLEWVVLLIEADQWGVAQILMESHLVELPSLRGMIEYLKHKISVSEAPAIQDLTQLQQFLIKLLEQRADYVCRFCGFKAHTLHWSCPSCHHWGGVKPVPNLEV